MHIFSECKHLLEIMLANVLCSNASDCLCKKISDVCFCFVMYVDIKARIVHPMGAGLVQLTKSALQSVLKRSCQICEAQTEKLMQGIGKIKTSVFYRSVHTLLISMNVIIIWVLQWYSWIIVVTISVTLKNKNQEIYSILTSYLENYQIHVRFVCHYLHVITLTSWTNLPYIMMSFHRFKKNLHDLDKSADILMFFNINMHNGLI